MSSAQWRFAFSHCKSLTSRQSTRLQITTVGEYNATTGTAINPSFITGLSEPSYLALSGNDLFVTNLSGGTVGEYNATTGAVINASFLAALDYPQGLAVASVPEPSPWSMIAVGGVALLGLMLRRRHRLL